MALTLKTSSNYQAWKITPRQDLGEISWIDAIHHLLGWALLAPSAHNIQPWYVEISPEKRTITIAARKKFMGTPSDKTGRQSHIGVGCFVSNFLSAAKSYGLKPKYQIEVNEKNAKVKITLTSHTEAKINKNENFSQIINRRAYRGRFKNNHLLPETLTKAMQKIVSFYGGRLNLITDPAQKTFLAELQELADRAVLIIPEFRLDLAEVLRPNDTLEERVMPADTFILPEAVAKDLEKALLTKGKFPGSFADAFARDDFQRTTEASALGVITMPDDTPEHWIKAGIAVEELWLRAVAENFEMGVMAAMVESGTENRALKIHLGQMRGHQRPSVVFRIGVPIEEVPHSPRLSSVDKLFAENC